MLTKALVRGGQARQTAVAQILKPENLFQPQATTAVNRYDEEFDVIATSITSDAPRMLSFGCSSGEELFSLHERFPAATIHGIDVNPLAVRTARKRIRAAGLGAQLTVAKGGDADAEQPRSYDAVLALAVFRHGDLNGGPPRCDPTLQFTQFERTVTGLADCVRPGGVLVIRHANFRFSDCTVANEFELVRSGFPSHNAHGIPTPVYGRSNELLDLSKRDDGIYRRN
jgi:SAM-dependent methyltransferase